MNQYGQGMIGPGYQDSPAMPKLSQGMYGSLQDSTNRLMNCVERMSSLHSRLSGNEGIGARDTAQKPPQLPMASLPGVIFEAVSLLEKQIEELHMKIYG